MGGKGLGRLIKKAFKSVVHAKPSQIKHYLGRAAINVAKGAQHGASALAKFETGDYNGAKSELHQGVKTVVGQNNINALADATIGKKAAGKINQANRIGIRIQKAIGQAQEGNFRDGLKTAMGKKAHDKLSGHLTMAKHHSDQAAAIHGAMTGIVAGDRAGPMPGAGGAGIRPLGPMAGRGGAGIRPPGL